MPEITHDAASAYIVDYGVLRASSASEEWITAFKSDMVTFLVAISRYSSAIGSTNIAQDRATLDIKTPVSTNFKMVYEYGNNNPIISLNWETPGATHVYNLVSNFNIYNRHPIYWAIYKGTNDIGITLARDTTVTLNGSVSSYTPPSESDWNDGHIDGETVIPAIKDCLSRFIPCSFFLVGVLDSVRNSDGYGGVLRTNLTNSMGYQITVTANSNLEIGGYINTTGSSVGRAVLDYITEGQIVTDDMAIGSSLLLCGDTCYYPQGVGLQSSTPSASSTASPINYIGPAWHGSTACITTSTCILYWGQRLKKNAYESALRPGPEVINLGSGESPKLYIRSFAAWMPVPPIDNSDSGDDDND